MSFWPLETRLLDELRRAARRGPLLELGAGEGHFARVLVSCGLRPILLDRGTVTRVEGLDALRGEAQRLPLRDATLGGVVCANLLRHLPRAARAAASAEIARTLCPGGVAVVFEDDPRAEDEAERNYRRVLELLARADPERGPCVEARVGSEFLAAVGPLRHEGRARNRTVVQEPHRPLDWLLARRPEGADEELRRLRESVQRHGMSYGSFWYRVHRREAR